MKRSEINEIMKWTVDFAAAHQFPLPPFAFFTVEDWQKLGNEYDELRDNKLGWDITDFGSGDFYREGLTMFTMRSGSCHKPEYFKRYSEKLMVARDGQVTPFHYHYVYIEDIINRGGGDLCVELWNGDKDGRRLDTDVRISTDGRNYFAPAGTVITLRPGESVSLNTYTFHSFWAKEGTGDVLLIEIAQSTPLPNDGCFLKSVSRYTTIEEDAPILWPLSSDVQK